MWQKLRMGRFGSLQIFFVLNNQFILGQKCSCEEINANIFKEEIRAIVRPLPYKRAIYPAINWSPWNC